MKPRQTIEPPPKRYDGHPQSPVWDAIYDAAVANYLVISDALPRPSIRKRANGRSGEAFWTPSGSGEWRTAIALQGRGLLSQDFSNMARCRAFSLTPLGRHVAAELSRGDRRAD